VIDVWQQASLEQGGALERLSADAVRYGITGGLPCREQDHQREKLDRLAAASAEGPLRLSVYDDGLVVYDLKLLFSDGTTLCAVQECTNAVGGRMSRAACSSL